MTVVVWDELSHAKMNYKNNMQITLIDFFASWPPESSGSHHASRLNFVRAYPLPGPRGIGTGKDRLRRDRDMLEKVRDEFPR